MTDLDDLLHELRCLIGVYENPYIQPADQQRQLLEAAESLSVYHVSLREDKHLHMGLQWMRTALQCDMPGAALQALQNMYDRFMDNYYDGGAE